MRQLIAFVALLPVVTATICKGGSGNWSFALASGVTDFVHGGVPLSKKFNCFDGCLATGAVFQNFKVALMNTSGTYKERQLGTKADRLAQLMKTRDDDDDPNTISCVDPQLRAEIRSVLYEAASCKDVVDTLVSSLNRPDWVINCVEFEEFGSDSVYPDMNFCAYIAYLPPYLFDIRLAKIDYT